jgi:endonuclease/exonuclease/phosphatase family metal-dependent hydrolase
LAGVRLATFNLLHGQSPADGAVDVARLREAVRLVDADLLGIQEVDRCQPRSSMVDQTAEIGRALGAVDWRFVPAVLGTPDLAKTWSAASSTVDEVVDGPTYGIGLVSRLPVRKWWARRFPAAPVRLPLLVPAQPRPRLVPVPDEPRLAIAALVQGASGPFTVVTTHLSFVPGYNVRQLRTLTRWVARMPGPVFLLGDLNLPGALPHLATGWRQLARQPTYPAESPRVQFDHVLAHGWQGPVEAQALPLAVSDHCALTVDVAALR